MENKIKFIIKYGIPILLIEKIVQHFLTAFFFLVDVQGIGTPDIGSNIPLDNTVMSIINIIYGLSFVYVLIEFSLFRKELLLIITILAFLDIIFEALFHFIGFITVSVIVSTVIILIIFYFRYKSKSFMFYHINQKPGYIQLSD